MISVLCDSSDDCGANRKQAGGGGGDTRDQHGRYNSFKNIIHFSLSARPCNPKWISRTPNTVFTINACEKVLIIYEVMDHHRPPEDT